MQLNIICFPYAGGSNTSFKHLIAHIGDKTNVTVVSYPGRGKRIREPLVRHLESLVEDSWQQIQPFLHDPYVLYGHSMGATIAYIIAHKIQQENRIPPRHIILSGKECPATPSKELEHLLPTSEFKNRLIDYGGMPKEILENEEYFSFFEPIIRADIQASETWKYQPKPKLPIPAIIMNGLKDNLLKEEILGWSNEFSGTIKFKNFPGDHFFIYQQSKDVSEYILDMTSSKN